MAIYRSLFLYVCRPPLHMAYMYIAPLFIWQSRGDREQARAHTCSYPNCVRTSSRLPPPFPPSFFSLSLSLSLSRALSPIHFSRSFLLSLSVALSLSRSLSLALSLSLSLSCSLSLALSLSRARALSPHLPHTTLALSCSNFLCLSQKYWSIRQM